MKHLPLPTEPSEPDGLNPLAEAPTQERFRARHEMLHVTTRESQQMIDITAAVETACTSAHIKAGTMTVASRHTTAAIVVQENEPLLLADLDRFLRRLAPKTDHYCHNDMASRTDVPPDERPNGHSHLRALLLPTSVQLVIADGRLDLGRWQRVFLIELDGPRHRQISLQALGIGATTPAGIHLVAGSEAGAGAAS